MLKITSRKWNTTEVKEKKEVHVTHQTKLSDVVSEHLKSLQKDGTYTRTQVRELARYCVVYVDGVKIPRNEWNAFTPCHGSHIHIYEGVKGGGGGGDGGKSIWKIIGGALLVVVGVVLSYFGFGLGTPLISMGLGMMIGGAAELLFPTAQPSLPHFDNRQDDAGQASQAYAVTGSQNAANPEGYLPIVLGKNRFTPPLAAKSWTQYEGRTQYFHMLVIFGQDDLLVEDIRIEKTPIDDFKNVQKNLVVTTGDKLKWFAKSPNEVGIGTTLTKAAGWVTRTVGTCEDISIDITFQSLFSIGKDTGSVGGAGVWLTAQYKKKEEPESAWQSFTQESFDFNGTTITVDAPVSANYVGKFDPLGLAVIYKWEYTFPDVRVYANANGTFTIGSGDVEIYPNKSPYINATVTAYRYDSGVDGVNRYGRELKITVSDGTFVHDGAFYVWNSDREFLPYNIARRGLPIDEYEVRVRRDTADSTSQYLYDECKFATLRGFTNVQAFNTPIPYTCLELRIQAAEQLSGYVSQLNALCTSVCPVWNGTEWIAEPTNNNAALARYTLTSPYMLPKPFELDRIDNQTFVDFYEFCKENGHTFNFICDTETVLWERLVQIMSVGRGAPTTDINGKWGAIIDTYKEYPKQLFTPRNSWGIGESRTFDEIPRALRVSFRNADNDYLEAEQYVYWDGYGDVNSGLIVPKASEIYPWEYVGVVDWPSIWKAGRRHLAKLLHRQVATSLSADWENLICRRGDLVGVAHDVLMNTFGTPKINALIYSLEDGTEVYINDRNQNETPKDEDGNALLPVGVRFDDTIIFSEPNVRYGLAIRDETARPVRYEITPMFDGMEHWDVYFMYPLDEKTAPIPEVGEQCAVGLLGQEYAEYLFAGAQFGERATAELTLVPYAMDEIEAAISGEIPPYQPPIILDVVGGTKLPTPTIDAVKSDEAVLTTSSGGTLPTIKAWGHVVTTSFDMSRVKYQISAKKVSDGTAVFGYGERGSNSSSTTGVVEKEVYEVRIRLVDDSLGITSDWSAPVTHIVIGRTTVPPPPSAVYMQGNVVQIQQTNRPLDVVGHVVTVCMDATDTIDMGLVVTNPYTTTGNFDLTQYAGRARRIYVQTIDELGLLSEAVSIVIQLGEVIPENVIFTISERGREWSGNIHNGYVNLDYDLSAGTTIAYFPVSGQKYFPTSGERYFPTGTGQTLQYTYQVYVGVEYIGASLFVEPQMDMGRVQKIEYRMFRAKKYFPSSGEKYFPLSGEKYFPLDDVTEWNLLPDKFQISDSMTIEIRVTTINSELTVFDDILTQIDVPDQQLYVEDVTVLADGTTRIPVPARTFRAMSNVQLTLQYIEGDTGVSAEFVRGSEIMEDGFIAQGRLLRVIDASGNLVQGNIDIQAKGY